MYIYDIHIYIYIYIYIYDDHQECVEHLRLPLLSRFFSRQELKYTHICTYISTANINTYTPIIQNTLYIILIRHCKHLLVVVYTSLSRNMFICVYIYMLLDIICVYIYIHIYIYIYIYIGEADYHNKLCYN